MEMTNVAKYTAENFQIMTRPYGLQVKTAIQQIPAGEDGFHCINDCLQCWLCCPEETIQKGKKIGGGLGSLANKFGAEKDLRARGNRKSPQSGPKHSASMPI